MRNAIAGSVVVPDFEMTFTEKSRLPIMAMISDSASEEMPLPAK